jgi:hypothetical protein
LTWLDGREFRRRIRFAATESALLITQKRNFVSFLTTATYIENWVRFAISTFLRRCPFSNVAAARCRKPVNEIVRLSAESRYASFVEISSGMSCECLAKGNAERRIRRDARVRWPCRSTSEQPKNWRSPAREGLARPHPCLLPREKENHRLIGCNTNVKRKASAAGWGQPALRQGQRLASAAVAGQASSPTVMSKNELLVRDRQETRVSCLSDTVDTLAHHGRNLAKEEKNR